MNKIFSKLCLSVLLFSSMPMYSSGMYSSLQKHSSAVWTSLYLLGSAVAVYVCHKDVESRVNEIEKSAPKNSADQLKQKERGKPVELAAALGALGIMLKFFNNVE